MAVFSKLILGSALLSSLVLAAPFNGKPAWTLTHTAYTTIDITTTIWIDDSKTFTGGTPTGEIQPAPTAPSSISTSAVFETAITSVGSTEPAPTFMSAVSSTTMSTSTIPAASPASFFTPSSASTPATSPASVVPAMSSSAPIAPVAPTPSISTTAAAAAVATTPAAVSETGGTGAPSSASDSATCLGEGAACQGDITFYGGGLGACGLNVDPTGNGIALPVAFMGPLSNTNPYCGKTLTIYNPATGESAQAVVMDKCEGCTGRSIDLTPALFDSLTNNDEALGRVHGVDWWFN